MLTGAAHHVVANAHPKDVEHAAGHGTPYQVASARQKLGMRASRLAHGALTGGKYLGAAALGAGALVGTQYLTHSKWGKTKAAQLKSYYTTPQPSWGTRLSRAFRLS